MPSPIEMMIDQALGITKPLPKVEHLTLRCPVCRKEQRTTRKKSDPPTAVVLLFPCSECPVREAPVIWLDKDGNEVKK